MSCFPEEGASLPEPAHRISVRCRETRYWSELGEVTYGECWFKPARGSFHLFSKFSTDKAINCFGVDLAAA